MNSSNHHRTIVPLMAMLFPFLTCAGNFQSSDPPVGTWTKSLNERTVTFIINPDQTYTVEFAGDEGIDVRGNYVISDNQITFNDVAGDYSADEPGVYEFKIIDSSLVFKQVDDPVYGRSILMEGKWSKARSAEQD
jgi:hypothetical protein